MTGNVLTRRQRLAKRVLDIIVAAIGLALLGPSMLMIGIAIRLTTGAPVFYRQVRVGQHGRLFRMPKFRTMVRSDRPAQPVITVAMDPRVSRLGAILRHAKVDELPQLWSVLRGDMSLVGPRPDVPGYADRLVGRDRSILQVRPGITGPATIRFRDEEEFLARAPDPAVYNDEILYPAKTRLNLAYLDAWSLRLDLACLAATLHPRFERLLPAWVGQMTRALDIER